MLRPLSAVSLVTLALVGPAVAQPSAGDEPFLNELAGSWSGRGDVLIRTNQSPLNVSCDVEVTASDPSFLLDGECGALFIERPITVELTREGDVYRGVYTGSRTGPAALEGRREGDSIVLETTWAEEVNGDRTAEMTLSREGDGKLRLTTEDLDPDTNEVVVTSDIALDRAE